MASEAHSKKIVLGVDLDDTIWDYATPFFRYCKEVLGVSSGSEDDLRFAYDPLKEAWGWSKEQLQQAFVGLIKVSSRYPVLPYPGSYIALQELRRRNVKNIAVTSRGEEVYKEVTEAEIARYFPATFEGLFYTNDIWLDGKPIVDKKAVCQREGVTHFADDSVRNITSIAETDVTCFLMTRPWNVDVDEKKIPGRVIRVSKLLEILAHIKI